MRNYIILNGKNSNTITGLLISTLPPITKPQIRTQTEEIDGLDGDIVTKLGYSAYEKDFEIGLYGEFDINEVIAYFNSEGTVVFSNEDDKYYNYQIISQIDYDKLIRFKKASIKMHVQPFKYPLTETPVEIEIQNVNNEAEAVDLDNTAEAPMTLALKGNTSQTGTPTPTSPIPVSVVSGDNDIKIVGKNLLNPNASSIEKTGIKLTNNGDGTYTANGTSTSANDFSLCNLAESPIVLEANTEYTQTLEIISGTFGGSIVPAFKDSNGTTTYNYFNCTANSRIHTKTTTDRMTAYTYNLYVGNNITITNCTFRVQLEKGTSTSYDPYQDQKYEVDLPVENLFNYNSTLVADSLTTSGITWTLDNGIYTCNGTNTSTYRNIQYSITLPAGTYRLSGCPSGGSADGYSSLLSIGGQNYFDLGTGVGFTLTSQQTGNFYPIRIGGNTITMNNLQFKPQIEVGSKVNTFVPYGTTPIELCKIGDYQDYFTKNSDGEWCKYNAIGKLVINGTENYTFEYNTNADWVAPRYTIYQIPTDYTSAISPISAICNLAQPTPNASQYSQYDQTFLLRYVAGQQTRIDIMSSTLNQTSVNAFKTWLGTHNLILYYVLKTPNLSLIEDEGLIGQLNALEQARSYDTKTHINQNSNDKPFIINATAVQKGSDTGIVDNEGNIYSKPMIDIEGSGTADIYLNNNQIFSVDLSSSNECIIDTAKLEAYNPSTNALMNRQVTGDYSSFILNTGENTIKISGNVTKATISNYTRWL